MKKPLALLSLISLSALSAPNYKELVGRYNINEHKGKVCEVAKLLTYGGKEGLLITNTSFTCLDEIGNSKNYYSDSVQIPVTKENIKKVNDGFLKEFSKQVQESYEIVNSSGYYDGGPRKCYDYTSTQGHLRGEVECEFDYDNFKQKEKELKVEFRHIHKSNESLKTIVAMTYSVKNNTSFSELERGMLLSMISNVKKSFEDWKNGEGEEPTIEAIDNKNEYILNSSTGVSLIIKKIKR